MPRWVENAVDSASESSDGEDDVVSQVDDADEQAAHGVETPTGLPSNARKKISISLKKASGDAKGSDVCHVCGKAGHTAGFVGATYVDCPNKPCYLCKEPGHTTATCPHRIAPEHGCVQARSVSDHNLLGSVVKRERDGRTREVSLPDQRWQVDSAVLKLHMRRCTALEFHPTRDTVVVSGDKKGQIAVWDYDKVYERTVYKPHGALVNTIRFLSDDTTASASSDGSVQLLDIETGTAEIKLNLNPDGWIPGVTTEKSWQMLHGLDICSQTNTIYAGDNRGRINCIDPRQSDAFAKPQLHKKDKVVSVHVHPTDSNLLLSAGNDHTARISDMRCLSSRFAASSNDSSDSSEPPQLAIMEHPKVVNAAYFSPRTGMKIMTTCIDNRLRIWDNFYSAHDPPDREIVHSHDFNRYLTPFRAVWDPKDPYERVAIVGRYISEEFSGVALHPVDMLDTATGRTLSQLIDPNLTTICPVNLPHPRADVIVSGSSRSLYAWRPVSSDEEEEKARTAAAEAQRSQAGEHHLEGEKHFIFYDADDTADQKKKRRAATKTEGETNGKKAKGNDK